MGSGRAGQRSRYLMPGFEAVTTVADFRNVFDSDVTLKDIQPIPDQGFTDVAQIVRVEVTPPVNRSR